MPSYIPFSLFKIIFLSLALGLIIVPERMSRVCSANVAGGRSEEFDQVTGTEPRLSGHKGALESSSLDLISYPRMGGHDFEHGKMSILGIGGKSGPSGSSDQENQTVPVRGRQGGDTFASAEVIPFPDYFGLGTTAGYNDDYDVDCGSGASISPDVVYSYQNTIYDIELIDIELCASNYNTKLVVYASDQTSVLACSDDTCGTDGLRSAVSQLAVSYNELIYIVVDGANGESGDYFLYIPQSTPICNWTPPDNPTFVESEPCGTRVNDGCNEGQPPIPVTEDGTIRAALWNGGGFRDTDWYEVVLDEPRDVTMACKGAGEIAFGLAESNNPGSGNCADLTGSVFPVIVSNIPCPVDSIQVSLPAGTHWFWVGTPGFTGSECPEGQDYWVRFSGVGCCETRGNVDTFVGPGGPIDVADLTFIVDYTFRNGPQPPCPVQADCNSDDPIDVADVERLVSYLFNGADSMVSCTEGESNSAYGGNVQITLNGGLNEAYAGQTNTLSILLQSDGAAAPLAGASIAFRINILTSHTWDSTYGEGSGSQDPYVKKEFGSGYFDLFSGARASIGNGSYDTVQIGLASIFNVAPANAAFEYTMQFDIPSGAGSNSYGVEVKPLEFFPGTWKLTDISGNIQGPPTFNGQAVPAQNIPTSIKAVFPIIDPTSIIAVTLDTVVGGSMSAGTVNAAEPITFDLRVTNTQEAFGIVTVQNAFRLSSPDGAGWSPLSGNFLPLGFTQPGDNAMVIPVTPDIIEFTAESVVEPHGFEFGWDLVTYRIFTQFNSADAGKTVCLDTTTNYAGGNWSWGLAPIGLPVYPVWNGAMCFTIVAGCCDLAGDVTNNGSVDISDLTGLVDFVFGGGSAPLCQDKADIDGSNEINITDLTMLVDFLFSGGDAPICGSTGS